MFPIAIGYWIWVPVEITLYVIVAYFSKINNDCKSIKTFIFIIALGCLPLWAFIAPDSKHLAFDMLLYDSILTITMTATLIFLTRKSNLKPINYLGIILVIAGFILMKI